jgi:hypothetical protein
MQGVRVVQRQITNPPLPDAAWRDVRSDTAERVDWLIRNGYSAVRIAALVGHAMPFREIKRRKEEWGT